MQKSIIDELKTLEELREYWKKKAQYEISVSVFQSNIGIYQ